jgi:hypothetical protein
MMLYQLRKLGYSYQVMNDGCIENSVSERFKILCYGNHQSGLSKLTGNIPKYLNRVSRRVGMGL